ncbi:MAG: deoxyribonuclease V [Xanthomonadales bacterium]|nr:deoxyribonuclease V [Xanthomonadales bacterium]NIX12475.1 deoxyribonuclease V [Xanthomonadales bacterium]
MHDWDLSPREAIRLQSELAGRVILKDRFGAIDRVAGVDVGFEDSGRITRAAVVVMTWPDMEAVERAIARLPTSFPYVPGLLSFRELPAVLEAFARLKKKPDLAFCDGQGVAHPRRLGVASHLGLLLDLPTIGVGKSRLVGSFEPPGEKKGDHSRLVDGEEQIGTVLRTRDGVRPLFVSPGHRVSQDTACELVLAACPRYRLPEPIRAADRLASGRASAGPA